MPLLPTWVGKRPRAIDEANISRQTYGEDSVGEGHQPTAPLTASVLVQVAERCIEWEPATQAAQHLHTETYCHPMTEETKTRRTKNVPQENRSGSFCAHARIATIKQYEDRVLKHFTTYESKTLLCKCGCFIYNSKPSRDSILGTWWKLWPGNQQLSSESLRELHTQLRMTKYLSIITFQRLPTSDSDTRSMKHMYLVMCSHFTSPIASQA